MTRALAGQFMYFSTAADRLTPEKRVASAKSLFMSSRPRLLLADDINLIKRRWKLVEKVTENSDSRENSGDSELREITGYRAISAV